MFGFKTKYSIFKKYTKPKLTHEWLYEDNCLAERRDAAYVYNSIQFCARLYKQGKNLLGSSCVFQNSIYRLVTIHVLFLFQQICSSG